MGLRKGGLGNLGRKAGWRSMRVWYGSAEVPESMFGGGGQTMATEASGDGDGKIRVEDKSKEQMSKLPPALGKKWKGKKKGGK